MRAQVLRGAPGGGEGELRLGAGWVLVERGFGAGCALHALGGGGACGAHTALVSETCTPAARSCKNVCLLVRQGCTQPPAAAMLHLYALLRNVLRGHAQ
jgi:hypothetical protein